MARDTVDKGTGMEERYVDKGIEKDLQSNRKRGKGCKIRERENAKKDHY